MSVQHSPPQGNDENSLILRELRNLARNVEDSRLQNDLRFDSIQEAQFISNNKFETLEMTVKEQEYKLLDARSRLSAREQRGPVESPHVKFASVVSQNEGFSTPSKKLQVRERSEEENDDEMIERFLKSPELISKAADRLNRRKSDAGLSMLASERQNVSAASTTPRQQSQTPNVSFDGHSRQPTYSSNKTVTVVDFAHKLKVAKIPEIKDWTKEANEWMTKFSEDLTLRSHMDKSLWAVVKLKVIKLHPPHKIDILSNAEILDALRIHVQDSARTRSDFLAYMVDNVRANPLSGPIECLSDFPAIVQEIQRFMADALQTYEYLADSNEEAIPPMNGEDGLIKAFLYPGLVHGFGKHFAETVKKDSGTASNFATFAAHISTETSTLMHAAMQARQVEKLMKAVRKKNGSLQQQQQQQQQIGRVGWQQSNAQQPNSLRSIAQKHADEMSNMEMDLLAVEEDEPSPRACHHAVFYGTACHKTDCRFDHTPVMVKRWRQHWHSKLETLLGEYKRSSDPPSATPASRPQYGALHMIENSDGMSEEGREMFELHRARQEHLQHDRNTVLDALLSILPESTMAHLAHAHNNSVNSQHGVKQHNYKN